MTTRSRHVTLNIHLGNLSMTTTTTTNTTAPAPAKPESKAPLSVTLGRFSALFLFLGFVILFGIITGDTFFTTHDVEAHVQRGRGHGHDRARVPRAVGGRRLRPVGRGDDGSVAGHPQLVRGQPAATYRSRSWR